MDQDEVAMRQKLGNSFGDCDERNTIDELNPATFNNDVRNPLAFAVFISNFISKFFGKILASVPVQPSQKHFEENISKCGSTTVALALAFLHADQKSAFSSVLIGYYQGVLHIMSCV